MTTARAIAVRRLLAFGMDWLLVLLWGSVLFGVVTIVTGGIPEPPVNPWSAQVIGFLTMTMPVTLYFAVCESSATQASFGKRATGLVVSHEEGGRLSFKTAILRNALKFAPWEFGHTVAQQAAFSGEAGFPGWVLTPAIAAFIGPAWWITSMFATGRTPYDRWARARVGLSSIPKER